MLGFGAIASVETRSGDKLANCRRVCRLLGVGCRVLGIGAIASVEPRNGGKLANYRRMCRLLDVADQWISILAVSCSRS